MLKQARIYLADRAKSAIVAALHYNQAGLCFEQDEAVVVQNWSAPSELVSKLRVAIQAFSFRDRNLRGAKLSEWPAFRASDCRSVREFEASYICISVRAANQAELCYLADVRPLGEADISLQIEIGRNDDMEAGRKLIRLHAACSNWDLMSD